MQDKQAGGGVDQHFGMRLGDAEELGERRLNRPIVNVDFQFDAAGFQDREVFQAAAEEITVGHCNSGIVARDDCGGK